MDVGTVPHFSWHVARDHGDTFLDLVRAFCTLTVTIKYNIQSVVLLLSVPLRCGAVTDIMGIFKLLETGKGQLGALLHVLLLSSTSNSHFALQNRGRMFASSH